MFNLYKQTLTQILSVFFMVAACSSAHSQEHPVVEMKTSIGVILIELYPAKAPKTVQNFLKYVKSGHYNQTIFHRVIDNFMVQGGGFDKQLKEKPTAHPSIPLEAAVALEHELKNDLGTISMARTNVPNSAKAQFFINVNNNDFLNHQVLPEGDPVQFIKQGETVTAPRAQALLATAGYTPFGRVIKGMDVIEKIKIVETKAAGPFQNLPVEPIIVESVKLLK
jgi:cyclophilin family peptidyl-prolyl cis-trans isomerase